MSTCEHLLKSVCSTQFFTRAHTCSPEMCIGGNPPNGTHFFGALADTTKHQTAKGIKRGGLAAWRSGRNAVTHANMFQSATPPTYMPLGKNRETSNNGRQKATLASHVKQTLQRHNTKNTKPETPARTGFPQTRKRHTDSATKVQPLKTVHTPRNGWP